MRRFDYKNTIKPRDYTCPAKLTERENGNRGGLVLFTRLAYAEDDWVIYITGGVK